MKNLILAVMTGLAGVVFADKVDLSKYKWALVGDSLSDPDFRQITTDQQFFDTYVDDFKYKRLSADCWYGVPSQAYHEKWIGPQVLGILEKALVR